MIELAFKTKIYIGEDSLDRLTQLESKNVFIVTDPFIVESGMINEVTKRLEQHDNTYQIFSDIVPDPPIEKVAAGVKEIQQLNPEIIIAIGGGSAIDAAKAMKDFANQFSSQPLDMKFIAIPTTSGTGTEVTSFAVITDNTNHVKHPLVSDSMLPDEAILDTALVKSVPPHVTADTGIDVLTHAIEAYVSTKANDFSDALAEKAVQLIFDYLPRCFKDGNDLEAREKVHYASCIAGMAFNMAGLGINHSIAHVCGAQFHIPHGRMNGILLKHVIQYNADLTSMTSSQPTEAANKYTLLAKRLGLQVANTRIGVTSFINQINRLMKELQMPVNLRSCGITKEQLANAKNTIIEAALQDGCTATNPRTPNAHYIETILESLY